VRGATRRSAILREHLELFYKGLAKLRPTDRQIVIWRIELGYSVDEIATRLGNRRRRREWRSHARSR